MKYSLTDINNCRIIRFHRRNSQSFQIFCPVLGVIQSDITIEDLGPRYIGYLENSQIKVLDQGRYCGAFF